MGVGAGLYMCDVVKKSSRSLSHLLMSSCYIQPVAGGAPAAHKTTGPATMWRSLHHREPDQSRPPPDNRHACRRSWLTSPGKRATSAAHSQWRISSHGRTWHYLPPTKDATVRVSLTACKSLPHGIHWNQWSSAAYAQMCKNVLPVVSTETKSVRRTLNCDLITCYLYKIM